MYGMKKIKFTIFAFVGTLIVLVVALAHSPALANPDLREAESGELLAPDGPVSDALRSAERTLAEDRITANTRLVNTLSMQDEESTGFLGISIPEPATAGLIGLAAVMLLRYRNRKRA